MVMVTEFMLLIGAGVLAYMLILDRRDRRRKKLAAPARPARRYLHDRDSDQQLLASALAMEGPAIQELGQRAPHLLEQLSPQQLTSMLIVAHRTFRTRSRPYDISWAAGHISLPHLLSLEDQPLTFSYDVVHFCLSHAHHSQALDACAMRVMLDTNLEQPQGNALVRVARAHAHSALIPGVLALIRKSTRSSLTLDLLCDYVLAEAFCELPAPELESALLVALPNLDDARQLRALERLEHRGTPASLPLLNKLGSELFGGEVKRAAKEASDAIIERAGKHHQGGLSLATQGSAGGLSQIEGEAGALSSVEKP